MLKPKEWQTNRNVLGVFKMERNDVMQREQHGEIIRYIESSSEFKRFW